MVLKSMYENIKQRNFGNKAFKSIISEAYTFPKNVTEFRTYQELYRYINNFKIPSIFQKKQNVLEIKENNLIFLQPDSKIKIKESDKEWVTIFLWRSPIKAVLKRIFSFYFLFAAVHSISHMMGLLFYPQYAFLFYIVYYLKNNRYSLYIKKIEISKGLDKLRISRMYRRSQIYDIDDLWLENKQTNNIPHTLTVSVRDNYYNIPLTNVTIKDINLFYLAIKGYKLRKINK